MLSKMGKMFVFSSSWQPFGSWSTKAFLAGVQKNSKSNAFLRFPVEGHKCPLKLVDFKTAETAPWKTTQAVYSSRAKDPRHRQSVFQETLPSAHSESH